MIFTIGIFTSLFFFILLLNKKNKSLPDNILGFWMLVIGIHLSSTYAHVSGYWEIYPHLIGITAPIPLLYGPLLYTYISKSLKKSPCIERGDYVHFLPFALSYLYMSRFYFFYTADEKRLVDQGVIQDFDNFSLALVIGIIASAILYAIYAYRLLTKYKALLENNFSNIEGISLNWLRSFIWGVFFIFLTIAIVLVAKDVFEVQFPFEPDFIFYALIVFAVLCLGFFGIRHENIFSDNVLLETSEIQKTSYQKSSLKQDFAADKHAALKQMMVDAKPYLQPNLTLNDLAEKLDISIHHLSQIINQHEGQNFNEFVNSYRVDEFIKRAGENSHFSYLAIALDSGFNSKSSFNAVFRKHKGMTPSQYLSSVGATHS